MGQAIPKLYTVVSGTPNINSNTFANIQDAIDAAKYGTTILLTEPIFSNNPIRLKSGLKFYGLNNVSIMSPIIGEDVHDIEFENITFTEKDIISGIANVIFRNCLFIRDIRGIRHGVGFLFSNSSIIFENPIFEVSVGEVDTFTLISMVNNIFPSNIVFLSPIIRVQYKNARRLETFLLQNNNTFEAFSSSISYSKASKNCNSTHCKNKRHTDILLLRGLDCISLSMNNTKISFEGGYGKFHMADSICTSYINGLTVSTTSPECWKIGDFDNTLLKSFMSNLKYACDVVECNCIKKEDSCKDICCKSKTCKVVPFPNISNYISTSNPKD